MANLKFLSGLSKNLPEQKTEGFIYFTTDDQCFYIDYLNEDNELVRSKISAEYAEKLRYTLDGIEYEITAEEIAEKLKGTSGDGSSIQPDWDQTDETQADFIKNKPDAEDALIAATETGLIEPVVQSLDGPVLIDQDGAVFIF